MVQKNKNSRLLLILVVLCVLILLVVYFRFLHLSPIAPELSTIVPEQTPVLTPVSNLAFPGAEGFGAFTPGGRFGKILIVTNLNDTTDVASSDYKGSLRWALESTWEDDPIALYDQRRFIVFQVGGIIDLEEPLEIAHPFTTIAGQTAPGGITLRRETLRIITHDVIVRGLRIRVGDDAGPTCCRDGLNISTSKADDDVYNIIVDHSSISWAIDENISFYVKPESYSLHNVTIQWSIISEGLHHSVHVDEGATTPNPHSMGMIIGSGASNISIHHNLFAQNWGRNPRLSGVSNAEFINNVIYAWGDKAVEISSDVNTASIISNYFKTGVHSKFREIYFSKINPASSIYVEGNITDDGKSTFPARILSEDEKDPPVAKSTFMGSSVVITDAFSAYSQVLSLAGAYTPDRDSIDVRIVSDVRAQAGNLIDTPDQVGGWENYLYTPYANDDDNDGIPSEWEELYGLNPSYAGDANDPLFISPNGYAWIEEYVNSIIP